MATPTEQHLSKGHSGNQLTATLDPTLDLPSFDPQEGLRKNLDSRKLNWILLFRHYLFLLEKCIPGIFCILAIDPSPLP